MTKDKKGVTLVSLVVTIIVMMIIFGITLSSATIILDNSNLTKIQTNLYMAKARAETLLEQYMFDGNIKHLIYFSEMSEAETIYPIGYYCKASTGLEAESGIIDATSDISCKVTKMTVNKTSRTFRIQLKSEEEFANKIKSIYTDYYDQMSQIKYKDNGAPETMEVEGSDEKIAVTEEVGRYLFVKWGEEQCLSQGLFKNNSNGKVNNDSVVNDTDYIIVVYDLYGGDVSVAYSKGYKVDGKIIYTLDSMLKLDENTTENKEEVEANEG